MVWILLIVLTTIGNFWMYLHSHRRFEIEHGIDLPLHASNVETYGNAWQFWMDCGLWSYSYFEIPVGEYAEFASQFKVLQQVDVGDGSTIGDQYSNAYLEGLGGGFIVKERIIADCDAAGWYHRLSRIENGKKVVVGIGTYRMNGCD